MRECCETHCVMRDVHDDATLDSDVVAFFVVVVVVVISDGRD
jgi:hypothetical protein